MSVLLIPVRVTKTLIAPTVTVLTAVLVNKDSLEMVHLAKVHKTKMLPTPATGKNHEKVTNDSSNCFKGLISGK